MCATTFFPMMYIAKLLKVKYFFLRCLDIIKYCMLPFRYCNSPIDSKRKKYNTHEKKNYIRISQHVFICWTHTKLRMALIQGQ